MFWFERPPAVSQAEEANGNLFQTMDKSGQDKARNTGEGQKSLLQRVCVISFGYNDLNIIMSFG